MKKKVALVIGILIFIDIFYFAFINQGQSLTLNYRPFINEITLDSRCVFLTIGLYGFFGGFILACYKVLKLKEKIKKLSRNIEKSSIETEESSDKVKALEAKIQTLEIALKNALNKS